jgi:DNA-binding NtrC family response regulator
MKNRVLVVDDDDDLRDVMARTIESLFGATVITAGSVGELFARGADVGQCDLAILDINLGPGAPSGLDAFRWLQEQRFAGDVVFLTGHARGFPQVDEVARTTQVQILSKPMSLEQLRELVGGRS